MVSARWLFQMVLLLFIRRHESVLAGNLVLTNKVVHVGRGQVVYISENELRFNIPRKKGECKVEVIVNEPTTQRVGKLSPQVFDCQFLPNEVKYSHNGSPLLEEDSVMLNVYRFSELETTVERLLMLIQINESESADSIVNLGQYLEVPEFYGVSSNAVDKNILSLKHGWNKPGTSCVVRTLSSALHFPAYGQVVVEDFRRDSKYSPGSLPNPRARNYRHEKVPCPGNKVCPPGLKEVRHLKANCEDFMGMGIKYQHLSPPSPDMDYIPLQVEIRDRENRQELQTQNIWIPVKIVGAIPNTPPRPAFMPMYILEIDQFVLTPLTTAAIDAEDDETPKNRLVFNVTSAPPTGFITHVDYHNKEITSFTWQDLHDMKIAYQPPNITHTERQNYEVEFQAIDSFFMNSSPIIVHFSIRTAETNAPRVSWNMGLTLLEGQSRPILWDNFQIVDSDNLLAVKLVTVDGLQYGRLTNRGAKAFILTVQDIKDGQVRYHHDDSDTTMDYIVFRIYDGKHSIRHKFPINILPKDDSPPFLVNNIGFDLEEGADVLIEKHMLMASDLDSSDDYILYNITKPPKAGELVKKYYAETSGTPVSIFLQRDLFRGLVHYKHFGGEIFQDSFEFILSDSHDPPNYSEQQIVIIHITPVKDQLPKEAEGTNRHIFVKETEITPITKAHLHFTDSESPDTQIVYTVTKPCYSETSPSLRDVGKLIFVDNINLQEKNPLIPGLTFFTQHAVTHFKVAYMPPQRDIGPDPILIQFEFSVSDQQGGQLSELIFNITVMPVDEKAPEILTNQIKTEEGASCFITGENIIITDVDTKNEKLKVQLKKRPQHGSIEIHGTMMAEGDTFSLEELNTFKVRYQHDDSESIEDTVVFSVTDGFNSADGVLKVQIIPVNDEPPELQTGLKNILECPEGGRVTITSEYLHATDPDSEDSKLTYVIARMPMYGMIQRGGIMVEKFTQLDVTLGIISYTHTGGEIGATSCTDTVTLIVSDGEAGAVDTCCSESPLPPPVPLHVSLPVYDLNITVTPINNQHPILHIGEMFFVYEGSSSAISLNNLNASDLDSCSDELIFIMETQPKYGYLENTLPNPGSEKTSLGINISLFSLGNVSSGYVSYVQSKHELVEPTADFFMVSITDGLQKSMPMPFYIVIKPTNDEKPQLHVKNITIIEGGICELGPATLNAEDSDVPQDTLNFSIVIPPIHGMILNGAYVRNISHYKQLNPLVLDKDLQIRSFTLDELKQGMALVYMHDDTETLHDSFAVQLTDGSHTVQKILHVRVMPVNDEKPHLIRNTGLDVEVAENKIISSVVLEAGDKDSSRKSIYYIINNGPTFGELKQKVGNVWVTLHPGMNFTQEDIDMNDIWYFHTIILGSKGHDNFRFYITDGEHSSPPESFYISILNLDKGDIVLLSKPITLTQGDRVTLMTDVLIATDGTGKPEKLLYAVSVPPVHGQIEYINYPGVPISSFSQLDVVAQKVCYVHDNSHEASKDSFSFIISNGLKAKDGFLELIIEYPDRIPPTLINNKALYLMEGESMTISSDILQLTDPDSPLEKLHYIITEYPRHGQLYLKDNILQQKTFSQADVDSMYLSYKHYGDARQMDTFSFIATDNINQGFLVEGQLKEDSVVFLIQVERVDKLPPKILIKQSPSTVENTKDGRAVITITARNLKASDQDSPDEDLLYVVLRSPYFGHLENTKTGDYVGSTFTQREVNQNAIRYIINPSFEVNSDSFEFKTSDPAGNAALPEVLEFNWSRIELAQSYYRTCENVGTLAVKVIRSGTSRDPAFVGIKVQEVSARIGLDFTHSTASLVQFDPGVSTKLWNIYIKNDGLEENHEILRILLKTPKNCVLGRISEATIEITDPRAGQCKTPDTNSRRNEKHSGAVQHHSPRTQIHSENGRISSSNSFSQILLHNRDKTPYYHTRTAISGAQPSQNNGQHPHLFGSPVLFHGLIPMKAPNQNGRADTLPIPALSVSVNSKHDLPQGDSATRDSHHPLANTTEQEDKCPDGWTLYNNQCYHLNAFRNSTWEDAERACLQVFDSHLTSVHSEAEIKWLWKFADRKPFWIGLMSSREGNGWLWSNKSQVTYNNVKEREFVSPGTSKRRCVLAWRKNEWVTRRCNIGQKERYICSFHL
ncbi:FRAS1-related extracellular matrix protein 1-like [Bombina bombina]|uniref:FRAS1-related extracellular matrix protein 1-like n=1 Tax=Bombina bombina TaxID=8345 RepID=UPI00235A7535|nr:FRAS1-related extracellular matrix protein 1-like [Bombina bombina]